MRLKGKIAIVVGAGQSEGQGIGNGRATVARFVAEGASVLVVDKELHLAEATSAFATDSGQPRDHQSVPWRADVARELEMAAMVAEAFRRWGRVDILHYNVGISVAGGDASPVEITEQAFDKITTVNLRGAVMAVKYVLPIMKKQQSGVITTVSSVSAWQRYPWVAYKASKAGLIAFTQQIAIEYADIGIRANVILPGLIDTPMAVDTRARAFSKSRADIQTERDSHVPLRAKMGTAWDVANAAVFLASDEANFITGVQLPVDGGALQNIIR
jgi:NAD(P)-dependent dehydrogenase (short-subunit alcohol dehydrogenase family)